MGREAGDATSQNRWSEVIEKEMKQRLVWKEKYGKEFKTDADSFKMNKVRKSHLPAFNPDQENQFTKPKEEEPAKTFEYVPVADEDLPMFEMYPVTPATKAKLFTGFSKEGKGRVDYLKSRKTQGPDNKFPFPVTEAQEIGWKTDEKVSWGKPPHGRSEEIRSFYRENGVFPTGAGNIAPK